MIIEITAVPKSAKFRITEKDGKIKIYLTSSPEDNKANIELLKELKILGCSATIAAGLKSRHKKLEVDKEAWQVIDKD
ncbi:DUF167 domain-containing protein [Candidatus Micrarchaeota archaeon]|nr:DUF167 domain-containing protein [Candidatus Micrarchaeota archaeon]